MRKVLVYGDVNLNIIDGSAIWLTSVVQTLLRCGVETHILLKTGVQDNVALDELALHDHCIIHAPQDSGRIDSGEQALSPRMAAQRMLRLDNEFNFDAIIVRGMTICKFMAMSNRLHSKSWLYVTDLPFPIEKVSQKAIADLELICSRAHKLFSQTEESRSYLEALCPAAAGKTLIMSPMIPDEYFEEYSRVSNDDKRSLQLIYAGKFAEDWKTLEALTIPGHASKMGINLDVTMIGNKFQQSRQDPEWHNRMRAAIETSEVNWLGGLSRKDTMFQLRKADLGIGWRSSALDSSMEISTKALEYAASGVPPIVNRTQAHIDIFGQDYPFFVDDSLDSVLEILNCDLDLVDSYRERVRQAVRGYSMSSAVERFNEYFERLLPNSEVLEVLDKPLNVLIAGHDFKFAGEIIEYFKASSNVNLTIDKWRTLHKNDESSSRQLLEAADVVICEWAGPNAVWYSNNILPHQRLFIRLHAFELRGPWLKNINMDSVTSIVCVSELYARKAIEATGWDAEKFRVIPNLVDIVDLNRPKLGGSEFRLGMVGMVPFIKRPDRALDLLKRLRQHDERYTLHIRGRMPWEYPYEWNKGLQRFAYEEFFESVAADVGLRDAVIFDDFGSDMASWLRRIGVVLSPSTRESFHLAPIEGMAGGAVPVVWERPGATEIFSDVFVDVEVDEMVNRVLALRDGNVNLQASKAARLQASKYDLLVGARAWIDLITNN